MLALRLPSRPAPRTTEKSHVEQPTCTRMAQEWPLSKRSSARKVQQAEEQEVPQGWQDSAKGRHDNVRLVSTDKIRLQGKVPPEDLGEGLLPVFQIPLPLCVSQLHFCPTSHGSYLGLRANSQPASSERSCAQQIALGSPQTTTTGRGHPHKQRKMIFLQGHQIFSSEEEKGALLLRDEKRENHFHLGVKHTPECLTT